VIRFAVVSHVLGWLTRLCFVVMEATFAALHGAYLARVNPLEEPITLLPSRASTLMFAAYAVFAPISSAQTPIALAVDARAISRQTISAHEVLPVTSQSTAREVTLVFPKWIPGDHGPTGPINDLVGLHFSANGKTLSWRRDAADMYAFHVMVPASTLQIEADFSAVNLGYTSTPVQGDLNFNEIVLYPSGARSDDVQVQPSLLLPTGWSYATALPGTRREGDSLRFDAVSLTTLVDSPVMMGSIMREFNITPQGESRPHFLDVFAETPQGLAVGPDRIEGYRKLVKETGELFGTRHYDSYRFLVEEHGQANDGLEHHQSSDDQVPRLGMVDPSFSSESAYLLAHEMTHSWNGKYRRPDGLATPNYQEPMLGDLLWVYEGLTSYWGEVLAARSGLMTPGTFRERLANDEAELDYTSGRDWRSLQDTAIAAQLLYQASPYWKNQRRGTDFYVEGPLLWLEVDATMLTQSHGAKSLDDFARAFYGNLSHDGKGDSSVVFPYTFEDVVRTLNSVVPYDWATFFRRHLDSLRPEPPAQGLEASGWHVVYEEVPSGATENATSANGLSDLSYSIGLTINREDEIVEVLPNSAAGHAGLAPEWKIVAVNQLAYSPDVLCDAIAAAKNNQQPIMLLILRDKVYADFPVDYHGGLRYPRLERLDGRPDLLSAILKPRSN
jgi:predicted metalloprotease with PDZ domain